MKGAMGWVKTSFHTGSELQTGSGTCTSFLVHLHPKPMKTRVLKTKYKCGKLKINKLKHLDGQSQIQILKIFTLRITLVTLKRVKTNTNIVQNYSRWQNYESKQHLNNIKLGNQSTKLGNWISGLRIYHWWMLKVSGILRHLHRNGPPLVHTYTNSKVLICS